ncbi:MAG: hypothetical protein KDB80_08345 [Planctomycetes bacterium]|nr:hypothetical protein [Planctomycetota bacterium]
MIQRSTSLLAVAMLGLGFAACSGGSDLLSDRTSSADCNAGGATFCLTACNLGCTIDGGCSVNSIAQNQPIELVFSQNINPGSVNAASISLKTGAGESPSGSFLVEGNKIRFIPEVSLIAGITTFGFRAQEEYFLTLPGGPDERLSVASASGDRLARTVSCSVSIDRGLVDLNNRAPIGTMIVPEPGTRDLEGNPVIVVEFDELIDVSAFQGSSTSSTPIRYFIRRTDPVTGEPDQSSPPVVIPGVPLAEAVLGANPKTRITLQPLIDLPSSSCVEVLITDQVRDLSGTPAQVDSYRFYTAEGEAQIQVVTESFTSGDRFDRTVSSARWGQGGLRPGSVGGDGSFGEFDIDVLPQVGGAYVWDTDTDITFPSGNTLLDDGDKVASNGRANFARFEIPSGKILRFVGSNPPVITVSGEVTIDGRVESDGFDGQLIYPAQGPLSPTPGGAGGAGGVGAGVGGRGSEAIVLDADGIVPVLPQHIAANGDDLNPGPMSGYAGQTGSSGGIGGPIYPLGADPNVIDKADINRRLNNQRSDQQIPGGSGGGFFAPGGDGEITNILRPGQPPDRYEDPIAGGTGLAFALPPVGVSSFDHFLFGGSGGGGGGACPVLVDPVFPVSFGHWTNGCGGGGGGGAVGFRVGRNMTITSNGTISLRGGDSPDNASTNVFVRGSSPGGGGSGGCFVAQVGGVFLQDGTIDLSGGLGGSHTVADSGFTGECVGGDGAPGYVRLESPSATTAALGTVVGLSPTADNIGAIQDADTRFVARSTWYPLNAILTPRLLRFELTVRIGTDTIVYTDDAESPNLPNGAGSPITFKLQGADVDPVELIADEPYGPWVDTTAEMGFSQPTGFRFLVIIDTSVESDVEIEKLELFYEV